MPIIKLEVPYYCNVPYSGKGCSFFKEQLIHWSWGKKEKICTLFNKKCIPAVGLWEGTSLPCKECEEAVDSPYNCRIEK
jgi:hypothetical protein